MNLPRDVLQAAQARTAGFQHHAHEAIKIETKLHTRIATIKSKLALNANKDACLNCPRLHQQLLQKVQDNVSKDYTIRTLQRQIEDLKTQNRINSIKSSAPRIDVNAFNESENQRPYRPQNKQRRKTISQIYQIPDKLAEEQSQLKQIEQKASLLKYKEKRERMLIKRLNSNSNHTNETLPYAIIQLNESKVQEPTKSSQPLDRSFHSQGFQGSQGSQAVQHFEGFVDAKQMSQKAEAKLAENEFKSSKSINDHYQRIGGAVQELRRQNQLLKKQCQRLTAESNCLKYALKQQKQSSEHSLATLQTQVSQIKQEMKQKAKQLSILKREMQTKIITEQLLAKKISNLESELQKQIAFSKQLQEEVKVQSELVCEKADISFRLGEQVQNLKYACKEEELRHQQTRRLLQLQEEESSRLKAENGDLKHQNGRLAQDLTDLGAEVKKQREVSKQMYESNEAKIKEEYDGRISQLFEKIEVKDQSIQALKKQIIEKEGIIERINAQFRAMENQITAEFQDQISQKNQLLIEKQSEIASKISHIEELEHLNESLIQENKQISLDFHKKDQIILQSKHQQQISLQERNKLTSQKQQLQQKYRSLATQFSNLAEANQKQKEKDTVISSLANSKQAAEERMAVMEDELSLLRQLNSTERENCIKVQKDLNLLRKEFEQECSQVNTLKEENYKISKLRDQENQDFYNKSKQAKQTINRLSSQMQQIKEQSQERLSKNIEYQTTIENITATMQEQRESFLRELTLRDECIQSLKREIEMTTNSYENMMKMKEEEMNELKMEVEIKSIAERSRKEEELEKGKIIEQERRFYGEQIQRLVNQLKSLKDLFQAEKENHKNSLKLKQSEFLSQREALRAQNMKINEKMALLQHSIEQEHTQKLKYLSYGSETHEKLTKKITLLEAESEAKEQKIQELESQTKKLQEDYQRFKQQTQKKLRTKEEKVTIYQRKIEALQAEQLQERNELNEKDLQLKNLERTNEEIIRNKELQISELLVEREENHKYLTLLKQEQLSLGQKLAQKQLLLKNLGMQVESLKGLFQAERENHKNSLKLKQSEFLNQRQSLQTQIRNMTQIITPLEQTFSQQQSQLSTLQQQYTSLKQTLRAKDEESLNLQAQYFTLKLQATQLQKANHQLSTQNIQSNKAEIQGLRLQNISLKNSLKQKTIYITRILEQKQEFLPLRTTEEQSNKEMINEQINLEKDRQIHELRQILSKNEHQIHGLSLKLKNLQKHSLHQILIESEQAIGQKKIEQELQKDRVQPNQSKSKALARPGLNLSTQKLPLDHSHTTKEIDDDRELEQKPKSDKHNILETQNIGELYSSEEHDMHQELQELRQSKHLYGELSQRGTFLGKSVVSNTSNKSAAQSEQRYHNSIKSQKFTAKLKKKK